MTAAIVTALIELFTQGVALAVSVFLVWNQKRKDR